MDETLQIVGAGVAGLSCARRLWQAGRAVRLLERSRRGPGGRCATRVLELDGHAQAVDYGPLLLHGSDERFVAALRSLGEARAWPERVSGDGPPCHPNLLREQETRLAPPAGVNELPRALARELPLELGVDVARLDRTAEGFALRTRAGEARAANRLVLAMALEQQAQLLRPLAAQLKPLRGTLALLESMGSTPCIALVALYPPGTLPADWQVLYPADSELIHAIANDSSKRDSSKRATPDAKVPSGEGELDSSKRATARFDALVLHARARWSRGRLAAFDSPDESARGQVTRELVGELGRILGPWARAPLQSVAHRWSFARTLPGTELAAPILHRFGDGFLGLCGDAFSPGGGVEGAFLSGLQLAERILELS